MVLWEWCGVRINMKAYDRVQAIFKPRRTDDLKSESLVLIGKELEYEAYWEIESGPYKGEWAMIPAREYGLIGGGYWVPSGDLIIKD